MAEAFKKSSVVVITESDFDKFGCPVCLVDHKTGSTLISLRGAMVVMCGRSRERYLVLADGVSVSPIGFGDSQPGELSPGVHPKNKSVS